MLDVKIPDFLKMRSDEEPSRLYMLIKKYEENLDKHGLQSHSIFQKKN